MCGILGVFSQKNKVCNHDVIEKMLKVINHRGPDDNGIFISEEDGVALGHVRLSILDLSAAGHQPMSIQNEDIVIVYNGEIYNFLEVKTELEKEGYTFKSKCDTEVILQGYARWGIDIVKRINGMFAFAIFDKRKGKLWLVRDRLGKKPLYYYFDEYTGTLVFSSEIKAILKHPDVPRRVDEVSLNNFLTLGYTLLPNTMFKGIKKIVPGHAISLTKDNGLENFCYWDVTSVKRKKASQHEYMQQIRELLEDSVRCRLISDVPLGAFLSGGVDSSLVVGIMSKILDEPVRTFSAAFDIGPRSFKYNVDADAAELTSKFYGTKHTRVTINIKDDIMGSLQKCVEKMDEPHGNPTIVSTYLLVEQIKQQGITVVLSGDGSDEIFGGYSRYQYDMRVDLISRLPLWFRNMLLKVLANIHKYDSVSRAINKSKLLPLTSDRYLTWWEVFPVDLKKEILAGRHLDNIDITSRSTEDIIKKLDVQSNQEMMMLLDLIFWISEESNMRMDKMTMAHSLENRSPFLDYRLVEYVMSIPYKDKVALGKSKKLLKNTFNDFLPKEVLERPKWGFFSPVHYWINEKLSSDAEVIIEALPKTGIFSKHVIDYTRPEIMAKQPHRVWMLIVFALWYNKYIGELF